MVAGVHRARHGLKELSLPGSPGAGAAAEGFEDGAGACRTLTGAWEGEPPPESPLPVIAEPASLTAANLSLGNVLPFSCLQTPLFSLRGGFCGQRI